MASFTERYHEYSKYHPDTLQKFAKVDWHNQPEVFREPGGQDSISLFPWLQFLKEPGEHFDWTEQVMPQSLQVDSLAVLSPLLYFTSGITSIYESGNEVMYLRANASAGGLYPVETYVWTKGGGDIPAGTYAFHPLFTSLIPMATTSSDTNLTKNLASAMLITEAELPPLILFFTVRFNRCEWRYGERSYRRMLLDAGHAMANTEIFARAQNLNFETHLAFDDDLLDNILDLDPGEVPVSCIAFGSELPAKWLKGLPPMEAFEKVHKSKSLQRQQNLIERFLDLNENHP